MAISDIVPISYAIEAAACSICASHESASIIFAYLLSKREQAV